MSLIAATATFIRRADSAWAVSIIKPWVKERIEAGADVVLAAADLMVPVETGALQASLRREDTVDDGKRIVSSVSANTPYAGYVEFGTGIRGASSPGAGPFSYSTTWPGMAAKPYLRPALEILKERGL
jgi:HK97 gp10 family phage protein